MAEQIKLTATLSAWVGSEYSFRDFMRALERGDQLEALNCVHFYGAEDQEKFSDSTKVGTAEITMTVVSRDELTTNAVKALKATLEQERAKWLQKQAEILEQISKFQALTFEAPADVEVNHG